MLSRLIQPVAFFIFTSLLLHLFFWEGLDILPKRTSTLLKRDAPIEITVIDAEKNDKNNAKQAEKEKNQIVEQKKQINDEVDEKTKFLSQFNQRVVKQTRAMKSGEFRNTTTPGQAPNTDSTPSDNTPQQKSKVGELPSLAKLRPQFNPTPRNNDTTPTNPGQESQSDDYLKDMDRGIQTMLSTREFVYYSYYSRIKEKIRQHWEPGIRERVRMIYRTGRTLASAKDIVTQVLVVLNNQGELLRIEVINASGNQSLDDAAIDAFKQSAPFPNPPSGMIEADGTIKIRWDFILEASLESQDIDQYAEIAQ